MFGLVVVFFGDEDAFAEESFVDFLAVGFGDEPVFRGGYCCQRFGFWRGIGVWDSCLHGGEFQVATRGIAYFHAEDSERFLTVLLI